MPRSALLGIAAVRGRTTCHRIRAPGATDPGQQLPGRGGLQPGSGRGSAHLAVSAIPTWRWVGPRIHAGVAVSQPSPSTGIHRAAGTGRSSGNGRSDGAGRPAGQLSLSAHGRGWGNALDGAARVPRGAERLLARRAGRWLARCPVRVAGQHPIVSELRGTRQRQPLAPQSGPKCGWRTRHAGQHERRRQSGLAATAGPEPPDGIRDRGWCCSGGGGNCRPPSGGIPRTRRALGPQPAGAGCKSCRGSDTPSGWATRKTTPRSWSTSVWSTTSNVDHRPAPIRSG